MFEHQELNQLGLTLMLVLFVFGLGSIITGEMKNNSRGDSNLGIIETVFDVVAVLAIVSLVLMGIGGTLSAIWNLGL